MTDEQLVAIAEESADLVFEAGLHEHPVPGVGAVLAGCIFDVKVAQARAGVRTPARWLRRGDALAAELQS